MTVGFETVDAPSRGSDAAPHERAVPGGVEVLPVDGATARAEFERQGAFVYRERFLADAVTDDLRAQAQALMPEINRNYLPGHKQGGSVSRHTIDRLAPSIAALYRSKALTDWLERVCGEALLPCPPDDPHAYALYYYTKPGDHIGWHYDTSYYEGRRYTLLLGVRDESSCRLDYELHTRDDGVAVEAGTVRIPPGGLVFFDGDRLRHRITPSAAGETRVSLTFEYVTNPHMRPWRRIVSNLKDAIAYFGIRQVLAPGRGRARGDA